MSRVRELKGLTASGSPYEIGRTHGSEGKEEIHNSLSTYESLFKGYAGLTWKQACEKALLHESAIERFRPQYIEEMRGVADGAGVTYEDILSLNARSEIALTAIPDGCTSFAVEVGGNTFLGQNWDWKESQSSSLLRLEIRQTGKPDIQMVTEGGIIGKIGSNSAGVGVCLNALLSRSWSPDIPIHLGLRAVLESESFSGAVEVVTKNRMASPAHFLIASGDGQMAGMEVSPVGTAAIEMEDRMVVHTNHLCDPVLKDRINDTVKPDSPIRLERIGKLIGEMKKDGDIDDFFSILSDHHNYPDSICRHSNPAHAPHEQMETIFSIVMNLSKRDQEVRLGTPCKAKTGLATS